MDTPSIETLRNMVSKEQFELIGLPETSVLVISNGKHIFQAIYGPFRLHGHDLRVLLNASTSTYALDIQILYIDEDDGAVLGNGVVDGLPVGIKFTRGWKEVFRD